MYIGVGCVDHYANSPEPLRLLLVSYDKIQGE